MDMNQDLNKLAREKAVDKIRKLLAMANDGRGNEQEAETAARQAEKMMRAYQIDAAECIMKELETADAFDRGVEAAYFGPVDPRHVPAGTSGWVGIIAFGVAQAFTCKVDTVMTPQGVKVRFSGFAMDVQLARWVYAYLCQTVYRLSVQNYKGQGATPAKAFRSGAAGTLQQRLFEIRDARNKENREATSGTALVLYDRKAERVEEMYGPQKSKQSKATVRDQAAYLHGREEAAKINISQNRPLGGPAKQGRLTA